MSSSDEHTSSASGAVPVDWSRFQTYSPMPPHGFLASSPQANPYMWGVQQFIPPYGTPPHPYVAMTQAELQIVQEERELKRRRRKQSNRESARRSRLRKQAECDDLAQRAESLKEENASLRAEMARVKCNSLLRMHL
ncbi:hypothetical protein OROHE_019815 [Orobanche hederae]